MDDAVGRPEPTMQHAGAVTIERGYVLAYRVFDAGDTIDLERAEKRVPQAKRVDVSGPLAEGLVIPARPLEMKLDPCTLPVAMTLGGERLDAVVCVHIFDFGALSIRYEIPIPAGTTLEALTPLCDALYDAPELDAVGASHRAEIMAVLGDAVEKPHDWIDAETYTIIFVEALSGPPLEELRRSEAVAKLLLGETSRRPLGKDAREDVLKHAFSYLVDDLVVIDWNSALVVEPSGSRLVANVLELATSQLLEFRFYDKLVDHELARVYDYVEKSRPRVFRSPYRALTRDVLRRFMELTEFTERADNAVKSVGDFYLARVYLATIRRFRVNEWRESVEAKLQLVAKAYELLKGEVEVSRSQLLELTIVLLIVVELVAALVPALGH